MKTTDIWFASFLKLRGLTVVDYTVISRGKGSFEFDVGPNEWKQLRLEFDTSDISKAKHMQASLKDLLF